MLLLFSLTHTKSETHISFTSKQNQNGIPCHNLSCPCTSLYVHFLSASWSYDIQCNEFWSQTRWENRLSSGFSWCMDKSLCLYAACHYLCTSREVRSKGKWLLLDHATTKLTLCLLGPLWPHRTIPSLEIKHTGLCLSISMGLQYLVMGFLMGKVLACGLARPLAKVVL